MNRLLNVAAGLLFAGVAAAQASPPPPPPQPLRPGQVLGPWSDTCITGVFVDGVHTATVAPGGRLTVPPLDPSLCGVTIRLCVYVYCGGNTVSGPDCTDYVIDCS